jgi:single-strand DNA-binding protein
MNGINRVFLMGYIGAKPELMTSKKGKTYVRLSLATHFRRRTEEGELESTTTWHRVTVWGKNAERCCDRLITGSVFALEGYLSHYSYQKEDGVEAQGFSVVAREVYFVGKKGDSLPGDGKTALADGFAGAMASGAMSASAFGGAGSRGSEFLDAMAEA